MAVETALSFLRILEQEKPLPRVVAIGGPQAFLREYVLDAARSRLVRDGRRPRTLAVGASGGNNLDAALAEIRAPDLFAPKGAFVCRIPRARRGQDDDRAPESEPAAGARTGEAALAEAIDSDSLAAELILAYERDSIPAKIRRSVERAGILVNCLRPFDNQLAQYATAFAHKLQLKLGADAAEVLVSRYSADLGAMANALAKAALHFDKRHRLQAADLMEAGAMRTPELFELAESLARGQIAPALALFDRAIALGRDVFEVLAVEIIPAVRRMTLAAALLEGGRGTAEIAAAMGFSPTSGLMARAVEGSRRFGLQRLRRAHATLCDLDAEFKMGLRRERQAAVSQMLVELMAR